MNLWAGAAFCSVRSSFAGASYVERGLPVAGLGPWAEFVTDVSWYEHIDDGQLRLSFNKDLKQQTNVLTVRATHRGPVGGARESNFDWPRT